MNMQRIFRHLLYTGWQTRRAFPQPCLDAIEQAIRSNEGQHAGEIRFAVEGGLDGMPLFRGQTAQERALEVFSQLRVWDTEHNNGVLIYILLADRAVEIVADRGIHVRAGLQTWNAICRQMEQAFAVADFENGSVCGIKAVSQAMGVHFPKHGKTSNELPDAPVLLG